MRWGNINSLCMKNGTDGSKKHQQTMDKWHIITLDTTIVQQQQNQQQETTLLYGTYYHMWQQLEKDKDDHLGP